MQESSKKTTLKLLEKLKPGVILDAPSGKGWLAERLSYGAILDGVDLYESSSSALYRSHYQFDLEEGLPEELPLYDAVVCCEGIEHFGNPNLFFKAACRHLKPGGLLVVTTPNIWYPEARLQFLLRGFFPGFPCLAGRIERGSHMHITPWSFPQLYLYLTLNGFVEVDLHEEPLSRSKRWYEPLLGWPQKLYCRSKLRKAPSEELASFWKRAGSNPSVYGRHLIVSARKN